MPACGFVRPTESKQSVRLVLEHRAQYPTMTAAVLAVSKQVGVGKESLRRWAPKLRSMLAPARVSRTRSWRRSAG